MNLEKFCHGLTSTCLLQALARAVYSRKDVVILDDIFSGMDAQTADLVSRRLLGNDGLLRKHGKTVILATHSRRSSRPS